MGMPFLVKEVRPRQLPNFRRSDRMAHDGPPFLPTLRKTSPLFGRSLSSLRKKTPKTTLHTPGIHEIEGYPFCPCQFCMWPPKMVRTCSPIRRPLLTIGFALGNEKHHLDHLPKRLDDPNPSSHPLNASASVAVMHDGGQIIRPRGVGISNPKGFPALTLWRLDKNSAFS